MVRINWTTYALENIQDIAEYISKDSVRYAYVQVERFFERVKILEDFPKTGKVVPEAENESIRELVIGSYRIIYRIVSDELIDILTVHHSRKRFPDL